RWARLRPGCRADRCGRWPGQRSTPSALAHPGPARPRVFARTRPQTRDDGSYAIEQLGQIADDNVRSALEERFSLTNAVHADDETEIPRSTGFHSSQCVFEHGRLRRRDIQPTRRGEIRVGRRLALQPLLLGDDPVNADVELIGDAGGLQYLVEFSAGGHPRPAQTRLAGRAQ